MDKEEHISIHYNFMGKPIAVGYRGKDFKYFSNANEVIGFFQGRKINRGIIVDPDVGEPRTEIYSGLKKLGFNVIAGD